MRITQLAYWDKATGWELAPIDFHDLTLLVGVSGVGKTQILNALFNLKKLAEGQSLSGTQWDVTFSIDPQQTCRWRGEFENRGSDEFYDMLDPNYREQAENRPVILYEELYLAEKLIIKRTKSEIFLNDQKTPKLSPVESAVKIFNQEETIAPVYKGFSKIIQSNDDKNLIQTFFSIQFDAVLNKYQSLPAIQESGLPTYVKLALAYEHTFEVFKTIKENFITVFPQVEDVRLTPIKKEGLHALWAKFPILQIKETGVQQWISHSRISSGMRKALLQISEVYLSPPGTIILIDEFENSLGINCIDVLTDLLSEKRKIQFIITSHHPYIINNIGMEHWKIVTRQGSVVTARDSSYFNLGKSRHEAFIQLMNLEAFSEGIAA